MSPDPLPRLNRDPDPCWRLQEHLVRAKKREMCKRYMPQYHNWILWVLEWILVVLIWIHASALKLSLGTDNQWMSRSLEYDMALSFQGESAGPAANQAWCYILMYIQNVHSKDVTERVTIHFILNVAYHIPWLSAAPCRNASPLSLALWEKAAENPVNFHALIFRVLDPVFSVALMSVFSVPPYSNDCELDLTLTSG